MSRGGQTEGVSAARHPSRAQALTPAPQGPASVDDSAREPAGSSPHGPDADFEARGQILRHKLAVAALVVVHNVLPWETCFWVEGHSP